MRNNATSLVGISQSINVEVQLQRLSRNQRDIAQLYGKLRSYVCEPKTHNQFVELNRLRDTAQELRNTNTKITNTLREDSTSKIRCSRMFNVHLKDFDTFRENTLLYLRIVKSHHTESF